MTDNKPKITLPCIGAITILCFVGLMSIRTYYLTKEFNPTKAHVAQMVDNYRINYMHSCMIDLEITYVTCQAKFSEIIYHMTEEQTNEDKQHDNETTSDTE